MNCIWCKTTNCEFIKNYIYNYLCNQCGAVFNFVYNELNRYVVRYDQDVSIYGLNNKIVKETTFYFADDKYILNDFLSPDPEIWKLVIDDIKAILIDKQFDYYQIKDLITSLYKRYSKLKVFG